VGLGEHRLRLQTGPPVLHRRRDPGGIDFKQEADPTYSDFAYLAFTVGMSFAVSDTEPTSTRTKRVALGHALISYMSGTGVLAVAINLVTDLVTDLGQ
jgi:uncharacterized membrane protein